MISLWIALHGLAATLWVGGMLFVHFALRPTLVEHLEPPQRLTVWHGVLRRFFPLVWLSIAVLHATGYALLFGYFGGMAGARLHVHLMLGIAWVMTLIFAGLYFRPWAALQKAVACQDWPAGGQAMGRIRPLVSTNLFLGVCIVVIGVSGRYW
ncbi:MAG: CopD family protein [Planctomycetota bacterium]